MNATRDKPAASVVRVAPRVMISFALLSSTAMLFIGAGIVGLVSPELVPPLARPAIAWSLIIVGALLDVGAIVQLMSARRRK